MHKLGLICFFRFSLDPITLSHFLTSHFKNTFLTLCVTLQYNLVHVAAGDLLRAEVSAGTENGKRAKEFMEIGQLVPNEIVVMVDCLYVVQFPLQV